MHRIALTHRRVALDSSKMQRASKHHLSLSTEQKEPHFEKEFYTSAVSQPKTTTQQYQHIMD